LAPRTPRISRGRISRSVVVVAKLHDDWAKALLNPEVRTKLRGMGADVVGDTPEQFGAFMRSESAKWAKLVKEADIRAE